MNKVRCRMQFFGRVQGVGFRYTAQHLANALGLTGWVYNEWDGTVVMEVQGAEHSIAKLLHWLERGTFIEIERIERQNIPLREHESCFFVRDD